MVSQLVGAVAKDVLMARQNKLSLDGYLAPLAKYVEKANDEMFVADLSALLELLAENTSVISAASRLMREKNTLFQAVLSSLPTVTDYTSDETSLGQYLSSIHEAGRQYEQVLVREMQTLLLHATNIDSAIVQVAAPVENGELDVSTLPGVPMVTVNRSLIGGARVFHNGDVRDDSWRARLTQVLGAVTKV
ncbi:MAG: hypothetical protein P8J32_07565 [bacterium]|jgi:hypothetical protein|nr:hypothetical protein [bacterium]